jgi:hypothetical protein
MILNFCQKSSAVRANTKGLEMGSIQALKMCSHHDAVSQHIFHTRRRHIFHCGIVLSLLNYVFDNKPNAKQTYKSRSAPQLFYTGSSMTSRLPTV